MSRLKYRITTDGQTFHVEVKKGWSWRGMSSPEGDLHEVGSWDLDTFKPIDFKSEKQALACVEAAYGTFTERVREWRVV
jgi:hypothetical protein